MKIYLELLIFIIPMFIFIFWFLWNAWSRKRLRKKYDPEKDLSKLGEEKRLEEIKIHNGIKTKSQIGRESSRGFGRRRRFRSSRDRTSKTNRATTSSNQERIMPSRGSELSFDNPASNIKPDNARDRRGIEKSKRLARRRLGRRRK